MRTAAVVVLVAGFSFAVANGFGAAAGSDKITLCHGTAGSWNAITVDVNAVSGHDGHAEDVIPAFTAVDNQGNVTNYPGKNLGTDFGGQSGADVLGNGCAAPAPAPNQLAHLNVIVKVVNNDGGTKQPSEFTVTAGGNGRSVSFAGRDDPGWSYTGPPAPTRSRNRPTLLTRPVPRAAAAPWQRVETRSA